MLDQALGGDPSHRVGGVVDAPATVIAQREGEGLGDLVRGGGAELLGIVGGHALDDTSTLEQNKNIPFSRKPGQEAGQLGVAKLRRSAWM
jgi:hypothetical protein